MRIEELDTPAVIVDLDIMEENLQSLAHFCRGHGLSLRPHTKTHKTPQIAKMQIESGCHGITVAKVGEAEVMAADEVLLSSATKEILPVTTLDGHAVGHGAMRGKPGPVYARLHQAYQAAKAVYSI